MDPSLLIALLGMLGGLQQQNAGTLMSSGSGVGSLPSNMLGQLLSVIFGNGANPYDQSLYTGNYGTDGTVVGGGTPGLNSPISGMGINNGVSALFQMLFGNPAVQQALNQPGYQQTFYQQPGTQPQGQSGGNYGEGSTYTAGNGQTYTITNHPQYNQYGYAENVTTPTTPAPFNVNGQNFSAMGRVPSYGQLPPGVSAPDYAAIQGTFGPGGGQLTRYNPWASSYSTPWAKYETPAMTSDYIVRNNITNQLKQEMGYANYSPLFFPSNQSDTVRQNNVKAWDLYKQRMTAAGLGGMVEAEPQWVTDARAQYYGGRSTLPGGGAGGPGTPPSGSPPPYNPQPGTNWAPPGLGGNMSGPSPLATPPPPPNPYAGVSAPHAVTGATQGLGPQVPGGRNMTFSPGGIPFSDQQVNAVKQSLGPNFFNPNFANTLKPQPPPHGMPASQGTEPYWDAQAGRYYDPVTRQYR